MLFCFAIQAQVSYSGNGNTGFGGALGSNSLSLSDDGTTITFDFNSAIGSNVIVIYIDSKTGGFANAESFTDNADGGRRAVSTVDGGNNPVVTFPAGFTADYAVAIGSSFAVLFELSTGSHTATGLTFTGGDTSVTFAQLGMTATDKFDFVAILNSETTFLSDEVIGTSSVSGNPGFAGSITFTGDRSYPNTWTGTTDNDWATATNWTNGIPDANDNVYIPMVTNQPTAAAAVTINKGIIKSGASVIAQDAFTGTITYQQTVNDTDWHLVSSAVVGEQYDDTWVTNNSIATGVTDADNRGIATYQNGTPDGTTGQWTYFQTGGAATTFGSGVGYSLKRTGAGNYTFTGTFPTTGVTPAISQDVNNWNLIGNPYPSYLNIADFITANSVTNDNLSAGFLAVYVWNAGTSDYDNLTTGHIHPGQAFFVNSKVNGNASITEAMQSHQTGITFYKNTDTSIELMLSNGTSTKKTKINYLDGKTTSLDPGFDIGMFDGVSSDLSVYTNLVNNNQGISFARQALPSSDLESMIIPVGVKAAVNSEITFSASALNLPANMKVFLEDRNTNTFTRLDEANSEFKITLTEDLNGIGRFYLHTRSSALNIDNVGLENISMYSVDNSTLRIVGLSQGKSNIKMFNILGKQVFKTSFKSTGVSEINLPQLSTGVYIVQLENENGKLNKKVVLE